MLNISYFILLIIYAMRITNMISGVFVFGFSILFFIFAYVNLKKRSNKTTAILQMICYSIPLSFRNVFGGDYASLPIAWFFVLGLFLLIHLLSLKRNIKLDYKLAGLSLVNIIIIIFSLIPLMIVKSNFLTEGFAQFATITFHNIVILIVIVKGRIINQADITKIEESYVKVGLITSLGIILQFIVFQLGVDIGNIKYYNNRQSFNFLFSDASHANLYLATIAFLSIQFINSNNRRFVYAAISIIVLIAAAVTSARTGLVAFFVVYAFYIFAGQNGIKKKVISILIGSVASYLALLFIKMIRPQASLYATLFDSSGRIEGYSTAFNLFLQRPWFGYGFSKEYIVELTGQPIPHFSFLQYLVQTGGGYSLLIFGIVFYTLIYAWKYRMKESWLILLALLGTCLIPDLFATRYITLLMALVYLRQINVRNQRGFTKFRN